MAEGVDYSFDRPTSPEALRAAGKEFACRYLAIPPNGKIITRAEADGLAAADVWIVANWEQGGHGNTSPETAGAYALEQARALGIPAGRPIYASVDFDVQPAQFPQVADWLRRFDAAIAEYDGLALYGSYYVIKAGFDEGWLRWGWQTYAWSYGNREPRAQLYQYHNGQTVAGCDVDLNRSYADDYGQWKPNTTPEETMQYEEFLSHLQRAFKYDLRPNGTGTPGQTWDAGPTFFESVDTVRADIATVNDNVLKITGGDLDYDALAAALKEQGVTVVVIEPDADAPAARRDE